MRCAKPARWPDLLDEKTWDTFDSSSRIPQKSLAAPIEARNEKPPILNIPRLVILFTLFLADTPQGLADGGNK